MPLSLRRTLVRLLIFFMAPVVLIASNPEAAIAAENQNLWQTLDLKTDRSFDGDITCRLVSRYTPDGAGVLWNESQCINGVDMDPWVEHPPEEGSDYELTFKGVRTGQGSGWETHGDFGPGVQGGTPLTRCAGNGDVSVKTVTGSNQSRRCNVDLVPDPGTALITIYRHPDMSYWSYSSLQGGVGSRYVQRFDFTTEVFIEVCASATIGGTPQQGNVVCADGSLGWIHWTSDAATNQPPAAGPGQGAGDACEATIAGEMGPSDQQSLAHRAGTIPGGTVGFPGTTTGFCQVNEVCVRWETDELIGGNSWVEGCALADWGVPYSEASAPEIPDDVAPPTLENDAPHAEDEQDFWDKVLDLLLGVLQQIAKGLKAVVTAVGSVVGGILDGLGAMFLPPDDLFDDGFAQLKDSLGDSNLSLWQDQYEDGMQGALASADGGTAGQAGAMARVAASDCQGPGVSWHYFEDVGLNGSGTIHPFAACSGTSEEMAGWSRLLLTAFIGVGAVLKVMQMILQAIGLQKQMDALNFDWSGATHYRKGYPD